MIDITQVYFSPSGTSAKIAGIFSDAIGTTNQTLDLLREPLHKKTQIPSSELAVVTLPVFTGRIPSVCREMLQNLHGDGGPAVAMVAYGNREYDDALLELGELLTRNGFVVVGAGAFVARHSIFPMVAAARPDDEDIASIKKFALACAEKLQGAMPLAATSTIKGNHPFRNGKAVPIFPKGNNACTNCGLCVKLCPVGAIKASSPHKTDTKKCITCTACIYNCPHGARKFVGLVYTLGAASFQKKCSARRTPDVFL